MLCARMHTNACDLYAVDPLPRCTRVLMRICASPCPACTLVYAPFPSLHSGHENAAQSAHFNHLLSSRTGANLPREAHSRGRSRGTDLLKEPQFCREHTMACTATDASYCGNRGVNCSRTHASLTPLFFTTQAWLMERYQEKDEMLAYFKKHQRF